MMLLISSGENGLCSLEIIAAKWAPSARKPVKRQNFCGVKLEYYYLPAGGTVSLHNGPLQLRLHGRIKPVCGAG
jgi:hypothetical protein